MNSILSLYDSISNFRVKLPRLLDARKEMRMKKGQLDLSKPDHNKQLFINELWGGVRVNNKYFSLYNTYNETFDPRYVPDDLYYGTIDPYFNRALDCAAIDDKNLYDLYFPDALQPLTVFRKVNGVFQDKQYRLIDEEVIVGRCKEAKRVVLKKAVGSDGGHGIAFWEVTDGVEKLKQKLQELGDNIVVQELIHQHENIAKLHPQSVNSIRILTLNWKNEIHVLSAIIRMGANGNNVDNGHSGGVFAGIDDDGRLKSSAFTYMTGQRFLNEHPTTHAVFSDCIIPNFDKCKAMVKRLAPRLGRISRLTSWDLSVNETGEPILIEVNLAYGGLFFHQIANGPVFGDMTKDIIKEVVLSKHG